MKTIDEKNWEWLGYPGHLIVSDRCVFHLTTVVGDCLISTVGDYRPGYKDTFRNSDIEPPNSESVMIGYDRYFETYVFYVGPEGDRNYCTCGCGEPEPKSWSELEGIGSNCAKDARENHMQACHKAARYEYDEAAEVAKGGE